MSRKALFVTPLVSPVIAAAQEAGRLVMTHYQQGGLVEHKQDDSPVTAADKAADTLIVEALTSLNLTCPIISEEGNQPDISSSEFFWLVDPIDGTKSFIRGSGFFTVNIALIDAASHTPVLGVIVDPVHHSTYYGSHLGAFRQDGNAAPVPLLATPTPTTINAAYISHSRSNPETEAYLQASGITTRIPCASSIKFCFLAEGKARLYPRFGPTMEWDVAAGHAILHAAGGTLTNSDGSAFQYGKPDFLNGNFIAFAKRSPSI